MSKQNQWIVGVNAVASSIEKDAENVREVLIEAGSKNPRRPGRGGCFQPGRMRAQPSRVSTPSSCCCSCATWVSSSATRASSALLSAVVLPATVLVWKAGAPYVFVHTARGFVPTPVQVLRQNAREVEIAGVPERARVAAKGVAALKAQWLGE